MSEYTQESLRFPPVEGKTVRADFDGGAVSSNFSPVLLLGVDRQIGRTWVMNHIESRPVKNCNYIFLAPIPAVFQPPRYKATIWF